MLESTDLVKINAKIGHIPEEERSYQKYYQWVVFILAFQACLLTLPNVLWKIWEGGRLEALCEGLSMSLEMVTSPWLLFRKFLSFFWLHFIRFPSDTHTAGAVEAIQQEEADPVPHDGV